MAIFPQNSDSDVSLLLNHLNIENAEKCFFLKSGQKHPFKTPCSIKYAFKHYVDLRGPISKKTIRNLAPYCVNPIEKKRMLRLAENSELMKAEITSKRYGLLDLFV